MEPPPVSLLRLPSRARGVRLVPSIELEGKVQGEVRAAAAVREKCTGGVGQATGGHMCPVVFLSLCSAPAHVCPCLCRVICSSCLLCQTVPLPDSAVRPFGLLEPP